MEMFMHKQFMGCLPIAKNKVLSIQVVIDFNKPTHTDIVAPVIG